MNLPDGYRSTFGSVIPLDEPDNRTKEQERSRCAIAVPASHIHREQVEWLEAGRIPLRMVTVLAGVGGLGKSQLSCLFAARNAGVTLIATAEDSPSTTVRPRLEAVEADLERVRFVSIKTAEGIEDGIAIPDDMEELERLVVEVEARLVIVDPLVAHLPMHIDSHKDQSVRRALAPLYRLAESQYCAVLALLHLNKAQGLAPLMRLGGSGAFGNAARSVLLLDRDPDDPDGEEGNQRVLAHIKCNVAPLAPSLVYAVKPIMLPATSTDPEVETSRLELIGESPHNGRSLLAVSSDGERHAIDDARDFLRTELADGSRMAGDLLKEARKVGISERTLQRARAELDVRSEKAGFDEGWVWSLPKAPSATSKPAFLHEGTSVRETAPSQAPSAMSGDPMYPVQLAEALQHGQITQQECGDAYEHHKLVKSAQETAAA
jgi:hypothetical protein